MRNALILALFSGLGLSQTIKDTSPRTLASLTFAELMARSDANGTVAFCRDCSATSPLAGGGPGTNVSRENGQWVAKQPTAFLAAGTGAVPRSVSSKLQETISVMDFGAKGDGSTDDTTAISKAIAAACAMPAPRVVFPSPPNSYVVTSTLQLCSEIDAFGYGHPTINYTGTGALFNFSATPTVYEPNIHGLRLLGSSTAGQIGILIQGGTAFGAHFYDLTIYHFGDVATHNGAGIEVLNADSASLSITHSQFANDGDNILTSNSPTDSLNVAENHFGGTGYCVRIEGGSGATAMRISHNNMSCSRGAVKFNPTNGGGIIDSNDCEVTTTVTDANSAFFDFLAGYLYVANNAVNTHGHAAYDFYVGNGVILSNFAANQGGNSTAAVFYVGTGANNTYWDNRNFLGSAALYSNTNYPGILIAPVSGTPSAATFWRGDSVWAAPFLTPWVSDIDAAAHSLANLRGLNLVGADITNGTPAAFNIWSASGKIRWGENLFGAETGSGNSGSDLAIVSYNDAGTGSVPMSIHRATGVVNFASTPTVAGVPIAVILKQAGTCNAASRGQIAITQGGAGVADKVQVCVKNASNAYVWASLY